MTTAQSMTIAAVVLMTSGVAGQPHRPATAAGLTWLAGVWTAASNGTTIEERWTPPAGGAMLAVSRTIRGERMIAFEFLRIIERDGGLVYIAQPQGRPPTEFVLTDATGDSVTFENRAHDFPKVIRYARRGDDTLEARVGDGGQKWESFVFRRTVQRP